MTDNKKAGRTFVLPTKQVDSSGGGRQPVCKAVFSAFYQLLQQNIKLIYSKENGLGLVATTTIRRGTYVHGVCDPRIEKHGYTVQVNTNTRATVLGPFSFVNYGNTTMLINFAWPNFAMGIFGASTPRTEIKNTTLPAHTRLRKMSKREIAKG